MSDDVGDGFVIGVDDVVGEDEDVDDVGEDEDVDDVVGEDEDVDKCSTSCLWRSNHNHIHNYKPWISSRTKCRTQFWNMARILVGTTCKPNWNDTSKFNNYSSLPHS